MPKIKDVKPYIEELISSLKSANGVKSVHIWGSYSKNHQKPNTRIKDIDVLARTSFHSEDFLAIDNNIVTSICSDNYLENQGYDPDVIKFSKQFLTFTKYNIDCWALSGDRKLMHWGAICMNKKDAEDTNKEAAKYAFKNIGKEKDKINTLSEKLLKNWYNHYCYYLNRCFEGMPTGWYKTEDVKIKDILSQSIKI